MAIDLLTRAENGAPLSATQNDTNLTTIQGAINAQADDIEDLQNDLDDLTDEVATNDQFEGIVADKQTIAWENVVDKPSTYAFCAKKTTTDQVVAGNSDAVITFNVEDFDVAGAFASNQFVAAVDGFHQINWSAQVELDSGTPTDIAITVSLRINGGPVEQAVLDLADNTGTRVYKGGRVLLLTTGQQVDLHIDISQTGTADWKVSANGANTFISGFLVAETP